MKYLHKHPSELDLTADQMAEVMYICEQLDEQQVKLAGLGGMNLS